MCPRFILIRNNFFLFNSSAKDNLGLFNIKQKWCLVCNIIWLANICKNRTCSSYWSKRRLHAIYFTFLYKKLTSWKSLMVHVCWQQYACAAYCNGMVTSVISTIIKAIIYTNINTGVHCDSCNNGTQCIGISKLHTQSSHHLYKYNGVQSNTVLSRL